MSKQYYLQTENFSNFGRKEVVRVTNDETDWLFAISGDEYRAPEDLAIKVKDALKKGKLIFVKDRKLIYADGSSFR